MSLIPIIAGTVGTKGAVHCLIETNQTSQVIYNMVNESVHDVEYFVATANHDVGEDEYTRAGAIDVFKLDSVDTFKASLAAIRLIISERYEQLKRTGHKNWEHYNMACEDAEIKPVLFILECASVYINTPEGAEIFKEMITPIVKLGRAVGVHIIMVEKPNFEIGSSLSDIMSQFTLKLKIDCPYCG